MKNINKLFRVVSVVLLLGTLIASQIGCISAMYSNAVKTDMTKKAVLASGNEDAIKAYAFDGGAGIGIDITRLDVIKAHPFKTLGAAIADGVILWGVYEGVDSLSNDGGGKGSRDTTASQNSGDTTIIQLENSDGNNININQPITDGSFVPQQGI